MEVLKTVDINFTYPDGTTALTEINLSVSSGERVAVLGANGSGKSTLFNLFNGLLQPTSGGVFIKELLVEEKNYQAIRRMVGMVLQDPDDQPFSNTVKQEIAYGLLNLGTPREEIPDLVRWSLHVVGLDGYEDKNPYNLSGGEKKRLALASVLAMKPEVLVLDEPTAAFDPRGVSQLVRLLNEINQRLNITLVFATHDVDVVPLLADRVYVLSRGRIKLTGATAEVLSQKKILRDNNLRLPRVAHLVELLQRDGESQFGEPESWARPGALPRTSGQARRMLEQKAQGAGYRLYDGKLLRRGYSTGTCAAAAAKAAVLALSGPAPLEVSVRLPGGSGEEAVLPVAGVELEGGCPQGAARAWVIKDAGDDPDITDGARIEATVCLQPGEIVIRGGRGVGVVTKPGLAVPPGQPAINPGPLQMIRDNVSGVLPAGHGAEVVIGVPEGEQLARRTMNPRLGIVGGISILGTTGIVEPMSEEAFKQALVPQLDMARAAGQQTLLLTPGRRGVSLAAGFGVPPEAVILISNFVGFMLDECVQRGFKQVVLWGHVGKLAKVSAGSFQTYNRIADGRAEAVAALAAVRGAGAGLTKAILDAPTAEAMVGLLQEAGLGLVWYDLALRASSRAEAYARDDLQVGTVMFSYSGEAVGWDRRAESLLREAGWMLKRELAGAGNSF